MSKLLNGIFIDGNPSGTLSSGGQQLKNCVVSITTALLGNLTISDASTANNPPTIISSGSVGALPLAKDLWAPAFYSLSNPSDVGKVQITWSL